MAFLPSNTIGKQIETATNNSETVTLSINVDYNTFWSNEPMKHAVVTVVCEDANYNETKEIGNHDPVRDWMYKFTIPVPEEGSYEYEYTATWNGQTREGNLTIPYDWDTYHDQYIDEYVEFRRSKSKYVYSLSIIELSLIHI